MGQHMDQNGPLGNFDEGKQHSQFMAETYKICLHKNDVLVLCLLLSAFF